MRLPHGPARRRASRRTSLPARRGDRGERLAAHRPRRARRRVARQSLALTLLAATVATALASLGGAGPSRAAVGDLAHGISVTGVVGYGPSEFGSFDGPGSELMWCVQLGAKAPTAAQLRGVVPTSVTVPQVAYLITRYKTKAAAGFTLNQTHAAISYLQHARYDKGYGAVTAGARRADVEAWFKKNQKTIWSLGQDLWVEAGDYAGTYEAKVSLSTSVSGGAGTGDLKARVVSAAGRTTPGMVGTVTLTGPATFANGDKAKTFTSGTTANAWILKVSGTASVTAKVTFKELPGTKIDQYDASTSLQTMWLTGSTTSASATATDSVPSTPLSITTTAGVTYTQASAATIKDTIVIDGPTALAGLSVPVTYRAYWAGLAAPAQRAGTAGGTAEAVAAAVTATVKLNASGNYTLHVQAASSKGAGYYTWVVSTPALLGGIVPAHSSPFAVPSETVRVTAAPSIRTQLGKQIINEAAGMIRVRDQVFVTRANPNQTFTATVVSYAPLTTDPSLHPSATAPAGTPALATQTVTITTNANGEGSAYTSWIDVPQPPLGETRWVTFVASVPAVANISTGYTSSFGEATETTSATRSRPGEPVVSTVASAHRAKAGDTISDTLMIDPNGAPLDDYPLSVTSVLWYSCTEPVIGQPIPDDAVMVQDERLGPVSDLVNITELRGKNAYTIPDGVDGMGWWVYTYSYREAIERDLGGGGGAMPSAVGDIVYPGVVDDTVHAEESILVPWQPEAVTTTSDARARAGDTLSDHLVVTGGRPGSTVKVQSMLWGPLAGFPAVQVLPPFDATELLVFGTTTEVTIGADGTGVADTAPSTPLLERGIYTWFTAIDQDPEITWRPWLDSYGLTAETSVVEWEPEVTTQTNARAATVGDALTDTFEVSGLPPNTETDIVSTLWVVPADEETVEGDTVPASAVKQGEVTTHVISDADGRASGATAPVVLADAGHAVWTETITPKADDLFRAWAGRWGVATEITDVFDVATTATPTCAVGRTMTDVAHVTGAVPPGSTLVFKVYAQSTSSDVDDDALVSTTDPIVVTGAGDYTSHSVSCQSVGTFYWREELTPPAGGAPVHVGAPRLPNESTTSVSVVTIATSTTSGGQIQDTALVSGTPPVGSYLVFRAYRVDGDTDVSLVDVGSLEPAFESDHIPVNGAGHYEGTSFTPTSGERFYWVETLYSADSVRIHEGVLGAAGETSILRLPRASPTPTPTPDRPDRPRLPITGANLPWLLGCAAALLGGGLAARAFAQHKRRAR